MTMSGNITGLSRLILMDMLSTEELIRIRVHKRCNMEIGGEFKKA